MKSRFHTLNLLGWLLAAGLVSGQAMAQSTATASATILRPITITKTSDMNFGNVVPSSAAGTVVLSPTNSRTPDGGVTIMTTQTGTVAAASFTVEGEAAATYTLLLPAADVTLASPSSAVMQVTNFTSDVGTGAGEGLLSGTASTPGTAGTQLIHVGGKLKVGTNQVPGLYTGSVSVTVAYN